MTPGEFICAAIAAKRELKFRRARSVITGNVGTITDGDIYYESGDIHHRLQLTTPRGIENNLKLEQLVFLDVPGDGTASQPAIAT